MLHQPLERVLVSLAVCRREIARRCEQLAERQTVVMRVDEPGQLLHQRSDTRLAGDVVKAETERALAGERTVANSAVTERAEHVDAGAAVVDEVVALGPVDTRHDIPGARMLGQMHQPIVAVTPGADEEQRVEPGTASLDKIAIQAALYVEPPVLFAALDLLDCAAAQDIGDADAGQHLVGGARVTGVGEKRVDVEGKDHLGGRQRIKDASDLGSRHLGIAILVQQEDRTTRPLGVQVIC